MSEEKLIGDMITDTAHFLKIDALIKHYETLSGQKCNCGGRRQQLNQLHASIRSEWTRAEDGIKSVLKDKFERWFL